MSTAVALAQPGPAPNHKITSPRQRGDLVFWQGHVGMMVDGVQLVHANAYHMAVQVEPLADTLARYEAKGLTVLATCRP